MKITLLTVGKTSTPYIQEGIDAYLSRLRHYIQFEIQTLPDIKSTRSLSVEQQKEREGEAILAALNNADYVALLDERGTEMTSREWAAFLQKRMASGAGRAVFVIGGPYGFSQAVYARANSLVSFSKMTFSHEMIRLFFTEQLYRAMTILRNEPYHHD
ncbi:MAG: 23S rRNA (pseudouridine(1915)-N(3))-methyltransferase RlmH [Muribaculaceae bacterium]|nr:23S rRNA (pseudouridine(1915)-N(3))-methyltransferase RlmH [Muribaculaceae bacterium]MBR4722643.1 23S rRNA (pseudouridine(1915)-N(3))-methyltransferase RlmH [Muribaculaceae bacterium]MBR5744787.1 23S rRNA (pseudouridine(1915)-N(3))-methyltransferase RlmH [Muribaculaceae bacterium]